MAMGASLASDAAKPAPSCEARVSSCRMAAGRYTSVLAIRTFFFCFSMSQRASFPALVVLPAPCRPASITTTGRCARRLRPVLGSPISAVNSSWTTLMNACSGVRLFVTSTPTARALTASVKLFTTVSATSASSSARRTSRTVAEILSSVSRPRPESDFSAEERLAVKRSNIVRLLYLCHYRNVIHWAKCDRHHPVCALRRARMGHVAQPEDAALGAHRLDSHFRRHRRSQRRDHAHDAPPRALLHRPSRSDVAARMDARGAGLLDFDRQAKSRAWRHPDVERRGRRSHDGLWTQLRRSHHRGLGADRTHSIVDGRGRLALCRGSHPHFAGVPRSRPAHATHCRFAERIPAARCPRKSHV